MQSTVPDFDQRPANIEFRPARVGGGIGHDEAGAARLVQSRPEHLDPEVIGVVGLRQAEGEAVLALADRVLLLVDAVDVERRIGHDEVELADDRERLLVIGIGLADRAAEAMNGEVHAREPLRLSDLLDAEDRQLPFRRVLMRAHEVGGLNEHAARAAGGVEDAAVIGLDDLDDETHDARGRVVLAALLHLLLGERAHEIFIDPPKGVAVDVERGQRLDEFAQNVVADCAVVLRQRVGEVRVVALDVVHRRVEGATEVRPFRQSEKVGEAGFRGQIDDPARLEGVRRRAPRRLPGRGCKCFSASANRPSA